MKERKGYEMERQAVEFFQPVKEEVELESSVALPVMSPGGLSVRREELVFEMTGDIPVVGELEGGVGALDGKGDGNVKKREGGA